MISDKLTSLIGKSGDTVIMEMEKGAIRKYADAIDDRNPLYWDDDYARDSNYGGIVAPPGFFGWPIIWTTVSPTFFPLREEMQTAVEAEGFDRILDGGIEYDFIRPIRVGDILASLPKIKSFTERESKSGKMVLSVIEITFTNQNGQMVARSRQTLIHR